MEKTKKCSNCGFENPTTAFRCEQCDHPFNGDSIQFTLEELQMLNKILIMAGDQSETKGFEIEKATIESIPNNQELLNELHRKIEEAIKFNKEFR